MVGVTHKTFCDWRKKEFFREKMDEALASIDFNAAMDIRQLLRTSFEEIQGLLQDPNPMVRLGAARLSLDSYWRMIAVNEDKAAINALETRLEQLQVLASQQMDAMAGEGMLALPHQPVIEAEVSEVAPSVALDQPVKRKRGRPRKGSQPATSCLDSSPAQPESP
jgi:hypothetical protein